MFRNERTAATGADLAEGVKHLDTYVCTDTHSRVALARGALVRPPPAAGRGAPGAALITLPMAQYPHLWEGRSAHGG